MGPGNRDFDGGSLSEGGLGVGAGSTALQEASGRGSGGTCHLQTMEVVVLQPMGK